MGNVKEVTGIVASVVTTVSHIADFLGDLGEI